MVITKVKVYMRSGAEIEFECKDLEYKDDPKTGIMTTLDAKDTLRVSQMFPVYMNPNDIIAITTEIIAIECPPEIEPQSNALSKGVAV